MKNPQLQTKQKKKHVLHYFSNPFVSKNVNHDYGMLVLLDNSYYTMINTTDTGENKCFRLGQELYA